MTFALGLIAFGAVLGACGLAAYLWFYPHSSCGCLRCAQKRRDAAGGPSGYSPASATKPPEFSRPTSTLEATARRSPADLAPPSGIQSERRAVPREAPGAPAVS